MIYTVFTLNLAQINIKASRCILVEMSVSVLSTGILGIASGEVVY